MADNVSVTGGQYTATIAADDIASVHYQRVKLVLGADGAADNDVDAGQQLMAASVPVAMASDQDLATSTWDHGSNRDIDTVAEQLTVTSMAAKRGVWVKASPANGAGILYLGNSDVTAGTTDATDGYPLGAGEETFVRVNNVNKIYAIGSTTNLIVYWHVE